MEEVEEGRRRSSRLRLLQPVAYKEDNTDFNPPDAKRTVLSYLIDMGVVSDGEKVRYQGTNESHTKEGFICRGKDGIVCNCCKKVFSVSKFQVHAGSRQRKPFKYLFKIDSKVSLIRCQREAWRKLKKESEWKWGGYYVHQASEATHDVICGACGVDGGGELICCDNCPSVFHVDCLDMKMHRPDVWLCMYCSCKFCGSFSLSSSEMAAISPLFSCSQCLRKFHSECRAKVADGCSDSNHRHYTFCGSGCMMIFKALEMLLGVNNASRKGFSWSLIRHSDALLHLSSKSRRISCNSIAAVAFATMSEFFDPIIDKMSGINLIQNVFYNFGSNIARLDYSGFFSFVLERDDEIISVASIRIHGTRLAEMPFIGTRKIYRNQKRCSQLVESIEGVLRDLGVDKLVIPAIPALEKMWRKSFGFKELKTEELEEVNSTNILRFPHSLILMKQIKRTHNKRFIIGKTIRRFSKQFSAQQVCIF